MQENETKKNKSTVVLSLRVPESEAAMYDAMCKDANLSRSELLRAIIKTKTNGGGVVINAPQKKLKILITVNSSFIITKQVTILTRWRKK